ncbi:MAG: sensor histidine kinase [Desulfobulbaceae bacterium]|jgi:signal transduction histidine kinase|nr:sensor histidine kinase [Desulfobulbaceae bacterium]
MTTPKDKCEGDAIRIAALARFTAIICHEFGNSFLGLKYLFDDLAAHGNLSEKDRKLLRLGRREIAAASEMIVRLQAVYRPLAEAKRDCDLHQTLEAALAASSCARAEQNIELEQILWRQGLVASVAAEKIRFVLDQLIENAIEAMPSGGILTVRSQVSDSHVLLSIGDTGGGLSRQHEERLFEPFFSTKEGESRQGGPRGFGLAISYHIVAEHGGRLLFMRNKERGCAFTMTLPQN